MQVLGFTAGRRARHVLGALLVVAASALCASWAAAKVRHAGVWPSQDPLVTLSLDRQPCSKAVQLLASKAGWSVIESAPSQALVSVHVKAAPASKVLDLLLADRDYVARRDGNLIAIAPAALAAPASGSPPALSAPSAAPAPTAPAAKPPSASVVVRAASAPAPKKGSGSDRVITGSSTRVAAGDVVRDLVVLGGSADVLGTVTGDLAVLGGSAHVHRGGHVLGDATAVGGSLRLDDGARVDGDVGVLGGSLHRAAGAVVGGHVSHDAAHVHLNWGGHSGASGSRLKRVAGSVAGAVTRTALLFVFGTVLLALATRRMDLLEVEVAARPMRSFALGVVGALAAVIAIVALIFSVFGIPIAIVGAILGVFGMYAGICAVLTTAGNALLSHRSKNPYLHLAVGCGLYLVLSSIPYLGILVTLAVALIGIGTLVATRAAGMIAARGAPAGA